MPPQVSPGAWCWGHRSDQGTPRCWPWGPRGWEGLPTEEELAELRRWAEGTGEPQPRIWIPL